MECSICCETVDKLYNCGNHGCEATACVDCFLKWFSTNTMDEADHCLFCGKSIDYIIIKQMTANRQSEYEKMKKNQIYDFHKSNINTIGCVKELFDKYVETKLDDIKVFSVRDDEYGLRYSDFYRILKNCVIEEKYYDSHNELMKEYDDNTARLISNIQELLSEENPPKRQIIDLKKTFVSIAYPIIRGAKLLNDTTIRSETLLYPCPRNGCLGYVVGSTHRCNNCGHKICEKCRCPEIEHEMYDEEKDREFNKREKIECPECETIRDLLIYKPYIHIIKDDEMNEINASRKINNLPEFTVNKKYGKCLTSCNRETYETCKLITKDSKPCPKCKNYINRWTGCDQMFCVICHTCFDWQTLAIMNPLSVHNPELIAWRARRGDVTIDNFQNIRCDILNEDFDILLNIGKRTNNRIGNMVNYYAKCNEIKDYLENHNVRRFNDQQIEAFKKYKITCATYAVFDMDYSRYSSVIQTVSTRELKKLKETLFEIYDKTFCYYKIGEYYQTLAQGMTDIFIKLQDELKLLDTKKYNNGNVDKLIEEQIEWCDYMYNIIENGIDILKPNIDTVNISCLKRKRNN